MLDPSGLQAAATRKGMQEPEQTHGRPVVGRSNNAYVLSVEYFARVNVQVHAGERAKSLRHYETCSEIHGSQGV